MNNRERLPTRINPVITGINAAGGMFTAAPLMAREGGAPEGIADVTTTLRESLGGILTDFVAHLPYFAGGLLMVIITWVAAALVGKFGHKVLSGWRARQSLKDLIERLLVILIWMLGLLFTAMIVFPGLTPARALGGLGLVSIAVGFAFKDIFENFFAGILLLWRFPFENGDFIECEGLVGRVEEITIRMSKIRKTSGELVVVPNSFLFKNPVQVLTVAPRRRVTIITGIGYGEDVSKGVEVIEGAVRGCETVDTDKPVQIFPQGFGASSIDIEVTWWTGSKPVDIRRSRGEVVTAVKKALDDAGIEIPFPYRTLTFNQPLTIAKQGADSP